MLLNDTVRFSKRLSFLSILSDVPNEGIMFRTKNHLKINTFFGIFN